MDSDRFHKGFVKNIGLLIHHDSKLASMADKEYYLTYENLSQTTIDKIMMLLKAETIEE